MKGIKPSYVRFNCMCLTLSLVNPKMFSFSRFELGRRTPILLLLYIINDIIIEKYEFSDNTIA